MTDGRVPCRSNGGRPGLTLSKTVPYAGGLRRALLYEIRELRHEAVTTRPPTTGPHHVP